MAAALMDELHQDSSYDTIYAAVEDLSGYVEVQVVVAHLASVVCDDHIAIWWAANLRDMADDMEDIAHGLTHWISMHQALPDSQSEELMACWKFIKENHIG